MIPPSQVISCLISTPRPQSWSSDNFIFFFKPILLVLPFKSISSPSAPSVWPFPPMLLNLLFPEGLSDRYRLCWTSSMFSQTDVQWLLKGTRFLNPLGWSSESACRTMYVQAGHLWKSRVFRFLAFLEILVVSESLVDLCLLWLFKVLG